MSSYEIRFSGAGGQGLQLCAKLLSAALASEGVIVAATQAYEPTSRGGLSRADMVVNTEGSVEYPLVTALDYLVVLDGAAVGISEHLLRDGGLVLVDSRRVDTFPDGNYTIKRMPFTDLAIRLGSERVANVISLATLTAMSGVCARETLERTVRAGAPAKLLDLNLRAIQEGYGLADQEVMTA